MAFKSVFEIFKTWLTITHNWPKLYFTDEGSVKSKTNWKGKFGMSKKSKSGGSPSVDRIPIVPESSGMFGVPLEDCVPSPNNEVKVMNTLQKFILKCDYFRRVVSTIKMKSFAIECICVVYLSLMYCVYIIQGL